MKDRPLDRRQFAKQLAASAGALFVGLGLIGHLIALKTRLWSSTDFIWKLLWLLLALKAAAMLVAAFPPAVDWARDAGLRLIYLHLGFLGIATLGLIAAARRV